MTSFLAGKLERVVAGPYTVAVTLPINDVTTCNQVFIAWLKSQELVVIPVFIFTNSDLVLSDGASVERRPDYAAQPRVARAGEAVHPAAALVLLLGAHGAAAADSGHRCPRALLGLLALGLIAGQTEERAATPGQQQR